MFVNAQIRVGHLVLVRSMIHNKQPITDHHFIIIIIIIVLIIIFIISCISRDVILIQPATR